MTGDVEYMEYFGMTIVPLCPKGIWILKGPRVGDTDHGYNKENHFERESDLDEIKKTIPFSWRRHPNSPVRIVILPIST